MAGLATVARTGNRLAPFAAPRPCLRPLRTEFVRQTEIGSASAARSEEHNGYILYG